MKLLDIINKEFSRYKYKAESTFQEQFKCTFWKHEKYADFWIVLECEIEELKDETYFEIYNNAKKNWSQYPEADKNISLLILNKVESMSSLKQKSVIDVENDEFLFKKYVLCYCNDDFSLVNNEMNLSDFLIKDESFKMLVKESQESECLGEINVLYSIAHKLPFIKFETRMESAEYSNELNIGQFEKENSLVNNFCNEFGDNSKVINKLESEQLYNFFLKND